MDKDIKESTGRDAATSGKRTFGPGTLLSPLPTIMVSCGDIDGEKNIITIGWTGIINSEPPMTYISVRKSRYSHDIIEKSGEFVINLVNKDLVYANDFCGVKSGRDLDKFAEQKLTAIAAENVKCPLIAESPVNIECVVVRKIELPSHDMYMAKILAVHVDEKYINAAGKIDFAQMDLVAYSHGEYFALENEKLGNFGYSVMKPKTKAKKEKEERGARRAKQRMRKGH